MKCPKELFYSRRKSLTRVRTAKNYQKRFVVDSGADPRISLLEKGKEKEQTGDKESPALHAGHNIANACFAFFIDNGARVLTFAVD